ncbi:MAG: lysylphosphatidylglycerol synthase transmembrane domain-containing protein [Clostridia bacterium]|nr:lysylphosphatidylglycerol synthase transmembrane domain-containing protein [Clostridia bacterium]
MEKENVEEVQQVKPANKKSLMINIIIILLIFIGMFIYMISVDGIDNILNLLKTSDYRWVGVGLVCIIIYWMTEALCLHIPFKKMFKGQKFANTFRISMLGQLFNNITPFSSGGQPIQAYEMSKDGKKMSDSLSILVMKFIISQTTLVVFTAIVLIFQFEYFASLVSNFLFLAIFGFTVNIAAIVFIFMIGINKKLVLGMLKPIYKLLGRLKIFKNVDERIEKLVISIDDFSNQFALMKKEKWMIVKMALISMIQFMAYYYITYAVYRAFGNSGVSVFSIIPAQAFLMMIMAFTPVPGAGIAAEGGFLLLFNSMFEKGTINMSILFWRVYTFYLPILIGSLFLIPGSAFKRKKKKHINEIDNIVEGE